MIRIIIPIINAIWIRKPRLRKKMNPSNHNTRIIMPIINKILIVSLPIPDNCPK